MQQRHFATVLKERGGNLMSFIENFKEQKPQEHILDCILLEATFSLIIAKAFDWSKSNEGWKHWHAVAFPFGVDGTDFSIMH